MKRRLWVLGFVAAAMMAAAPALAADTIKIGATEPLSGTFKDIGERYLEGVQYAAKVINDGCWERKWRSFRLTRSLNRTWPPERRRP